MSNATTSEINTVMDEEAEVMARLAKEIGEEMEKEIDEAFLKAAGGNRQVANFHKEISRQTPGYNDYREHGYFWCARKERKLWRDVAKGKYGYFFTNDQTK